MKINESARYFFIIMFILLVLFFLVMYFEFGRISREDADRSIKNVLYSIGRYDWFVENGIEVIYTDDKTYSMVESKKLFISLDTSRLEFRDNFIFELGHFVYSFEWCPLVNEKYNSYLVCEARRIMPREVLFISCIRSHIFADEFRRSGGRLQYNYDLFNRILNFTEDDVKFFSEGCLQF